MKLWKRIALAMVAGLGILALAGCSSDNSGTTPEGWTDSGKELDSRYLGWKKVDGVNFPIVYFAYNSDKLAAAEKTKLESVANYLRQNSEICAIIEGHCDERGSEEYNRGLGERRAITVKNYVMKLGGTTEDRLRTVSYGKDRPAVMGHDESAWSKNRRGELLAAKKK